ncbi:MAG: response regulator, partial [Phycisphaerae bacterium]|nr:response regulator [Gemmatimonadaceae bacterium]
MAGSREPSSKPGTTPSATPAFVRRVQLTYSVRAQLILLALFIALPLLIGSAVRIATRLSDGQQQVREDVQRIALLVAERVEERVRSADALLIGLTPALRLDTLQSAHNDSIFAQTLGRVPQRYANFFAFDKSGTRLGTAIHNAVLDSIRGQSRPYFAPLLSSGGFFISPAAPSRALNDSALIVPLARSVDDAQGRPVAVIGTTLRIDSLGDIVTIDMPLPSGSVITILDTSGIIIARSQDGKPDSRRGQNVFASDTASRRILPDRGTLSMTDSAGVERLFGFTRTKSAPWIVNVGIPKSAVLAPVYKELFRDLFAGSVTLIFAIGAAMLLGGYIARPLGALSDDARAIAAGEDGRRSRIRSKSEVGVLASAFNQMADTVERRNSALAESERRYRLLFDSNPLPMYAWDAELLSIVAANEAAQERYGYSQVDFLRLKITDLLDASEQERFARGRVKFEERRLAPSTWIHRTATGEQMEMEVISTQSRRMGRESWLSVSIDVTARHAAERALARSEEQLRQSQKMEAIGAFAGGIAHDFNNLLTGMLGYCELAMDSLPTGGDAWNDVQEVRALALRGADLTRQILAVSRKQVMQYTVFDVNTVVQSIDRLLRRLIGEHIMLQTELGNAVGSIRADAAQIEQVLLNLAANSRDSMQPGGTLTIRTARVSAHAATKLGMANRDWVSICVSDTGIGMTEEVKQRIFEPFYTTKERGKGTGLGLSLVYATVEQSGGVIRVTSAPNQGASFEMYFPSSDEPAIQAVSAAPATPARNGTELILLAEDEDSVRAVAREALERRGYRVLAAADGPSALALARSCNETIDLLLTDVVMPGMNGRELAEALLLERPGTRVLFASGYTDDAVLLHGVRTDELSFIQ